MYKPTCKSYFSGGGLMDIGLMRAGVNIIQSSDLDPKATAFMKLNPKYFGHEIITGDIKDMLVLDQPQSDIMSFTYPCTKYSTIADIHGTRTGDELFLHALRHIAVERPEMYIVENVPGMRKFKIVMEAMSKLKGYYVHTECPLNAANWVPQRRERLIIIATLKPFSVTSPKPTLRPRLKDLLENNPDVPMPQYVLNRLEGKKGYRDKPIIVDPDVPGTVAPTCVAHYSKDLGTRLVKDKNAQYGVRPFSTREYGRLQGIPDDVIIPNELNSYRIIGNGVEVNMAQWVVSQFEFFPQLGYFSLKNLKNTLK